MAGLGISRPAVVTVWTQYPVLRGEAQCLPALRPRRHGLEAVPGTRSSQKCEESPDVAFGAGYGRYRGRRARLPRSALPDGYFHAYARGVAALTIFQDGDDRSELLSALRPCETRFGVRFLAACVLSTHHHVVVQARRVRLSQAMHWLNLRYAHYFNRRYELFGHVFAERFST